MSGICTPVVLYLVLAIVPLVMNGMLSNPMLAVISIAFVLLQGFILNYVCSLGYSFVVWIIVIMSLVSVSFTVTQMPATKNKHHSSTS